MNEINIESLIKRKEEPQLRTFEVLGELVDSLNNLENYRTIDKIIGKDGTSQKLASQIAEYNQKLSKQFSERQIFIKEQNSVDDVLENMHSCLFLSANRVNEGKNSELVNKNITGKVNSIRDYLFLLKNYNDFENKELGTEDGFIGPLINNETEETIRTQLTEIQTDKEKYVKFCRNYFYKNEVTAIKTSELEKMQNGQKYNPHFEDIDPETLTDEDFEIYNGFKQQILSPDEFYTYAQTFYDIDDYHNPQLNFKAWIANQLEYPENLKWFDPKEYETRNDFSGGVA